MKVVETRNGEDSALRQEDTKQWILYVDGASNENGSKVDMMLVSLEGHKIHCTQRFGFHVSNNEAEYKTLIVGLRLAQELQARNLKVYIDSQPVVKQVNDIYLARGDKMAAYLEKAKELMGTFPTTSIEVIL